MIQFRYAESVSKSLQVKRLKRLKREYINELPLQTVEANFNLETHETFIASELQTRLSSHDETDVLIVHPNTLTWSGLAPYKGWDTLFERVKRDVKIAHDVCGHQQICRLGVRYINRIDVPMHDGISRYEDYLTINLSLPDNWEGINNYGWRFEKLYSEKELLAIVQSAIVTPEIPNHAAFLLDIDVIRNHGIPAKSDEVFLLLEEMRVLKNEIFEISITDTARASFA